MPVCAGNSADPAAYVFTTAGGSSLTEEQLDALCPSAAAIAAIVKPGMKFFDVSYKSSKDS